MTEALFLVDSYLKESRATVVSVKDGKYVTLNQTVFYPRGGGQPHDTGRIIKGNEVYNILYGGKFSGEIFKEVDHAGLQTEQKRQSYINVKRVYAR
jgi:misacylated tRNA(Ala) deacylase